MVQYEKDTSAKVKDMKKMPIIPDIEDLDSDLFKKKLVGLTHNSQKKTQKI